MQGFERAMQEYERELFDPYGDEEYEEEYDEKIDYLETQAEYLMDEMALARAFGDEY